MISQLNKRTGLLGRASMGNLAGDPSTTDSTSSIVDQDPTVISRKKELDRLNSLHDQVLIDVKTAQDNESSLPSKLAAWLQNYTAINPGNTDGATTTANTLAAAQKKTKDLLAQQADLENNQIPAAEKAYLAAKTAVIDNQVTLIKGTTAPNDAIAAAQVASLTAQKDAIQTQLNAVPTPVATGNNTLLYVGIGIAVLVVIGVIVMVVKHNKQ